MYKHFQPTSTSDSFTKTFEIQTLQLVPVGRCPPGVVASDGSLTSDTAWDMLSSEGILLVLAQWNILQQRVTII